MNKRLVSLDMAKGIGILSVLHVHCSLVEPVNVLITYLIGTIMLIFFFITGYNYKPGKRSIPQNIKQRAKQILIPFYLYSAVLIALFIVFNIAVGEMTPESILNDAISFYCGKVPLSLTNVVGPYWFLPVMFLSSVLFFLIVDFSLKSLNRTVLVCLPLTAVSAVFSRYLMSNIPWRLPLIPVCTAVMLIGAYIGQKKLFENPPFEGEKLTISVLCTAVLAVTLTVIFGDSFHLVYGDFGNFGGWSVFTAVIICLVQIYMLVFGCELMSVVKPLEKALGWFGRYSIQILLTHVFVGMLISRFTGLTSAITATTLTRQGAQVEEVGALQVTQSIVVTLITIGLLVCWLLLWNKIKERFKAKKRG